MTFPSRIFLVGLPGSGKSTVGAYLAKALNYTFQDLDAEIEEVAGRSIADIFEEEGEEYFRKLEATQLRQMTDEKMVISTGGGAPCFLDGMKWMNENGFTIFLNPPFDTIVERISKEAHRPLIGDDPEETLINLLSKRMPHYRQAKMEASLMTPCEILTKFRNFFSGKS